MMYDSRPWAHPARDMARSHMETVPHLHRINLAIVSGRDETHLLQFEDRDWERMIEQTIPAFVREIEAVAVIVSSPAPSDVRDGVHVMMMERSLETYYVPIVRISNADLLIGDFRSTSDVDPNCYGPILEALIANWIGRDKR